MCGIVALVRLSQRPLPPDSTVRAMAWRLKHRGPDAFVGVDHERVLAAPRYLHLDHVAALEGTVIGERLAVLVGPQRGQFIDSELAPLATGTVHPSSILRAPDDEARRRAYHDFVEDLRAIAGALD